MLDAPLTFLMHWSFKTGYHEIAARKFLATGAPFPECQSWKRFHGPGSVEGWILVEAENADACYEHAAEWAECLDEVTLLSPMSRLALDGQDLHPIKTQPCFKPE